MNILCAAFGGLAIKLLDLLEIANLPKNKRPDLKDFFYWLPFLLFPFLGAGLVGVYIWSKIEMSPILAFNVGSLPL